MILIEGKKIAAELREELKKEVLLLKNKYDKVPGLTVILIGELAPSKIYVKNKEKSANEVGLKSEVIRYPDSIEEKTVLDKIHELNKDESKYSEFVKDFEHTYFKEVFDELKKYYKLGRVRLLLKEPRSTLSWHRDPEPRLHIPIVTNPGCLMVIDKTAQHMPADGSVWITNNTKYHNAFNGGEENRIHLVACVLDYKFN